MCGHDCLIYPFLTCKTSKIFTRTSLLCTECMGQHLALYGCSRASGIYFCQVSHLFLLSVAQILTLHVRLNRVYTFLHGQPAPSQHHWLMLPEKQPLGLSSVQRPGVGPSRRASLLADVSSRIPEVTPDVDMQLCSESTLSMFIPCIIAK